MSARLSVRQGREASGSWSFFPHRSDRETRTRSRGGTVRVTLSSAVVEPKRTERDSVVIAASIKFSCRKISLVYAIVRASAIRQTRDAGYLECFLTHNRSGNYIIKLIDNTYPKAISFMQKITAIKGTTDILPGQTAIWRRIETVIARGHGTLRLWRNPSPDIRGNRLVRPLDRRGNRYCRQGRCIRSRISAAEALPCVQS